MEWGMDELGGTQLFSGDYFKEVCILAPVVLNRLQFQKVVVKLFKIGHVCLESVFNVTTGSNMFFDLSVGFFP